MKLLALFSERAWLRDRHIDNTRTILTLRRELATERQRLFAATFTLSQRDRTIVALRARCDQLEALHRDRKQP